MNSLESLLGKAQKHSISIGPHFYLFWHTCTIMLCSCHQPLRASDPRGHSWGSRHSVTSALAFGMRSTAVSRDKQLPSPIPSPSAYFCENTPSVLSSSIYSALHGGEIILHCTTNCLSSVRWSQGLSVHARVIPPQERRHGSDVNAVSCQPVFLYSSLNQTVSFVIPVFNHWSIHTYTE